MFNQSSIIEKHWIISITVTGIIASFYFNIYLFLMSNDNDFGEYFIRAEHWSEGILYWRDGSDKLLSFIEFIAIKLSNVNDFVDIYHKINNLITILMLGTIFLYLTNKNTFNVDFKTRVLTMLFVFSLPFFILKGRTVDQSYLFGITLLLWISVYHIKGFSSIAALLVFTARPEGVMIIPLFFLVFIIDKSNRKNVIINFIIFILILCGYKLFDIYNISNTYQTQLTYQEYELVSNSISLASISKEVANILLIPLSYLILALVVLKSYLYFGFFVVGVLASLKEKRYYIYHCIPILYILMISILLNEVIFESRGFEFIGSYMTHNISFFPHVPGSSRGTPIFSQERYVLFLYPFISIFVVNGVFNAIKLIQHTLAGIRLRFVKYNTPIVTYIVLFFSIVNLGYFYQDSINYKQQVVLQRLSPLDSIGLALRKHRDSILNSVVIYDFCEAQGGSSLINFLVLSGVLTSYTKICSNSRDVWVKGHPRWVEKQGMGYPHSYQDLLHCSTGELSAEINKHMNFKIDRAYIDYEFTVNNKQKINSLFEKPNHRILTNLSIDYVISRRKITLEGITLIDVDSKGYKIYKVEPPRWKPDGNRQ